MYNEWCARMIGPALRWRSPRASRGPQKKRHPSSSKAGEKACNDNDGQQLEEARPRELELAECATEHERRRREHRQHTEASVAMAALPASTTFDVEGVQETVPAVVDDTALRAHHAGVSNGCGLASCSR